jgi:hypothetical protein
MVAPAIQQAVYRTSRATIGRVWKIRVRFSMLGCGYTGDQRTKSALVRTGADAPERGSSGAGA